MNLEELGKRAIKCKHFYWMPGMSLSNGRTIGTWKEGEVCGSSDTSPPYDGVVYPMLDDPATLGCLLHLVREAWGVERAAVWWNEHDQGWVADVRPRNFVFVRDSEAHALVAALEAVT